MIPCSIVYVINTRSAMGGHFDTNGVIKRTTSPVLRFITPVGSRDFRGTGVPQLPHRQLLNSRLLLRNNVVRCRVPVSGSKAKSPLRSTSKIYQLWVVRPHMCLPTNPLIKSPITQSAVKSLMLTVNPHMLRQVLLSKK